MCHARECNPPGETPSAFVTTWADRLAPALGVRPRALDVAMGRGRHARWLAARGYTVFGVDIRLEAIRTALAGHPPGLSAWCADLTMYPLPESCFDLVVVSRYLDRERMPVIVRAVRRGGALIYETFTDAQRTKGRGPTSPAHLLRHNELPRLVGDAMSCETVAYEEVDEPDALARFVARRC